MRVLVVVCIALIAFSVSVSAKRGKSDNEDKLKSYKKIFKECQKNEATRVDASILKKLKKHKQVDLPDNFGVHKLCIFEGIGLIGENNTIDEDKLKKKVSSAQPNANVENIVMECKISKATLEETALNIYKCLAEHSIDF